ncbi:MAG: SDR family NAD(P)-dependent oxidoreductase [Betaproteobacteria bacterium]|nr:SDR family NAD(P)-dependent oxidoreductase [Betaproteobacteria bacterium]
MPTAVVYMGRGEPASMHSAIVTGVSRGLGEALARLLLGRGFRVVGIGRSSSPLLAGSGYRFVACDLADVAAIDAALDGPFADLAAAKPESVCLINNAAVAGPVGVLGHLGAADVEASLAVNLAAPIVVANRFCSAFADHVPRSRVINVSSGAAQSAIPGGALYSIAKAGLEMLTRALAAERTAPGFRAITLRPGIIDTQMQTFMRSQSSERLPNVAMFQDFHASGRLVPADVAAARIVDRLVLADVEHGRTYSYAEL